MSREDPQMKIRMPEDLKVRIEDAAKAAGRSMNAEIAARLQASFEPQPKSLPEIHEVVEKLQAQIAQLQTKSVGMFVEALRDKEIIIDEKGNISPGPNFQLETKITKRSTKRPS